MSNSSVFKMHLKVLRSSADLQLYDSEFQTDGALTQNAFADNVSDIRGTVNKFISRAQSACRMVLVNKSFQYLIENVMGCSGAAEPIRQGR